MTTASQIIEQTLGLLGVKAPGDAVNGDEANGLLSRLNVMLDGWQTQSLNAYATQRITGTLPANTETGTIGPTASTPTFIIDPRPIRIESGSFFTYQNLDYPLEPIGRDAFDSISLKANSTTGPAWVYYEPGQPTGTLRFYPRASASITVTLVCQIQVAQFANLTTDYTLAPGYRRAIAFSLAEEVCSDYERTVTPQTAKIAAQARRDIKRANHQVPQLAPRVAISELARFYSGYSL